MTAPQFSGTETKISKAFQGLDLPVDENDTRRIFDRLESGERLQDILAEVEGP